MRKFVKERSSFSGRHFARPHHAKVDFKPLNTSLQGVSANTECLKKFEMAIKLGDLKF